MSTHPAFVLELCSRLALEPMQLEPLKGGCNSEVFLYKAKDNCFVLKRCATSEHQSIDRYIAEVEFLNYAQLVAPDYVPRLICSDRTSRSIALEYLEGQKFLENSIPAETDVEHAIRFFKLLNVDLGLAKNLVTRDAADGFMGLTEHLENVCQRIGGMVTEHMPRKFKDDFSDLITALKLHFDRVASTTEKMTRNGYLQDSLDPKYRCVSPSDFGFHNAIRTSKGVKFFDFEFSGWDDPAKAVADFDLQPRVPILIRERVMSRALTTWNEEMSLRYEALLPILRLKWACIIVGFMNPNRWPKFTKCYDSNEIESTLLTKLRLAKQYLSEVQPCPI